MTWWSTIKAKAREYITQHYSLGSNRSCEENLANAQELIHGAMFVRDGVEPDVRPPAFSITLKCNLFCRVPQETWCLQLWLASFSIFSTQVLLPFPVFFWRFLHRKSQSLLSALQQQLWVPTFHLILYWHDLLQLQGAINKYMITGVWQDRPFKYNTYSKIFTQFMGTSGNWGQQDNPL